MMMRSVLILMCALAAALPVPAQEVTGWDARGSQLTRAELQEMLARYEATAASRTYSGSTRERARAEAEQIRQRLSEGDIQIGDRIALRVERHLELTDTFPVLGGRVIRLPEIGDIPLTGVLRSELQEHLTTQIGRYVRDPMVYASSLIRLEIMGAVGRPGFHSVPSDLLISDALMMAGGPSSDAALDKLKIRRGDRLIIGGDQLREAVIAGRTLDQLNLRAGDAINVPVKTGGPLGSLKTALAAVSGLGSLIWLLVRVL
ncbi:MAG TPA: polysaccharide biosynthesis/export family protein [Longimicrobiales bacterium]|nr:polysaccharide biosynthesis/export family protein [Longimicrobiales bacterium]